MSLNLMILGASARAAAWSARRAGYSVVAADLFADRDMQEMGVVHRVDRYPEQLAAIASGLSPDAWLYTGGLENHPALVERVTGWHTLWGNTGGVLRNVRDPRRVRRALQSEGLPCPEVQFDASSVPRDGGWLRKPLQSCGGRGITPIESGWGPETDSGASYFQRFVAGDPYSAVYVAAAGRAELLGVTKQLVGVPWSGASRFGYAGSVGPVPLTSGEQHQWQEIGRCLGHSFGLRGLFGVDAIRSHGRVLPVEVNPRYTASVEVLERASDLRAIALYAEASSDGRLPEGASSEMNCCSGKGIVYATEVTTITCRFSDELASLNQASLGSHIADIPATGQRIRRGHPVVSVLVDADDARHAEMKLKQITVRLRSLL